MEVGFLVRGIVLGLSVAAPVGPIGLLCIQRTLAQGRRVGLVSGLGAATADALYGAAAAFGLTAVTGTLVSVQTGLRLAGGLFLIYLGVRTLRSRPAECAAEAGAMSGSRHSLLAAYLSTLLLTITNPMTILSFAALFASAGLVGANAGPAAATLLVFGVLLGSALWWLLLSAGVGLFRSRLRPERLVWINRLSGAAIIAFGLAALSIGIRALLP